MTASSKAIRQVGILVLPLALLVVIVTFGVPMAYDRGTHMALAAGQLFVTCASAWALGASALAAPDPRKRQLAIAGSALVLPFALFSLAAGFGPPEAAGATQNELRYVLLTIGAVLVGAGFIALTGLPTTKGAITPANPAGLLMVMATPLYAAFTLSQWGEYAASHSPHLAWIASYDRLSLGFLFAGVLLTYSATAFTANALNRAQLIGRLSSIVLVALSIIAMAFVAIRIAVALTHGPMWGFNAWYEMPGFVLLIPAVPWLMPCAIGVLLLHRAGAP
jgi:hypothetical protein